MVPVAGTNTDLSDVTTRASSPINTRSPRERSCRFNSSHRASGVTTANGAGARPGGVLEGAGWGKPKGMHWRTYERLCDEHDALNDIMSCNFMARFGLTLENASSM
jgi:hypothetical protein